MHRRELLQALLGLGSVPLLGALSPAWAATVVPPQRRLLLVELNGGNDGLNAVVPYADADYYRLRPNLAIARDQVVTLDERIGLHPALAPLLEPFKSGDLAVVLGLGYAQPNRSHFRSIAIWDTATDSEVVTNTGWLTRLGAHPFIGTDAVADAIVIGRNPAPVEGGSLQTLTMSNPDRFAKQARLTAQVRAQSATPALAHLIAVQDQIVDSAGALISDQRPPAPGEFPKTQIGNSLAQAARLLIGKPAAGIVKVAQTGYDTHQNQRSRQERNLQELANGLIAFRLSMRSAGVWDDTLVMTYSEFGRRAAENGSGGTDHGTAAPHFVLGGKVRGGLHGEQPSLARLEDGDLRYAVDFRSYYNTVLARWWSASGLIEPTRYRALDFV